jgi:hypothetical protein
MSLVEYKTWEYSSLWTCTMQDALDLSHASGFVIFTGVHIQLHCCDQVKKRMAVSIRHEAGDIRGWLALVIFSLFAWALRPTPSCYLIPFTNLSRESPNSTNSAKLNESPSFRKTTAYRRRNLGYLNARIHGFPVTIPRLLFPIRPPMILAA